MAEDVAKLMVEIDARTALMRTELSKAAREISNFEKDSRQSLKRFDANLDRAADGTGRFSKSMGVLKSSVSGFATGAVTGLIASFGVGQITSAITNALNFADAIGDTADQLGVSAEFLQEFRFATEEFGGSVEGADNALGKFNLSLGKAQSGNKAAMSAYKELGVSVLDVSGKARSAESIYVDVAQAISRIESPTLQAAAAQKIFGKDYAEITPLLRQGAEGYREVADRARELGVVLSNDEISRMGEAQRKIEILNQTMNVQWTSVVGQNADVIARLTQNLSDIANAFGEAIRWRNKFVDAQTSKAIANGWGTGTEVMSLPGMTIRTRAPKSGVPAPQAQPRAPYDAPGRGQPVRTTFGKPQARGGFNLSMFAAEDPNKQYWDGVLATLQFAEPLIKEIAIETGKAKDYTAGLSGEAATYLADLRTSNDLALMRAEGRGREAEEAEALRRVEQEISRIDGLSTEQQRELLRLAQAITIEGMRQVQAAEEKLALEERWADRVADASRPDPGVGDENVRQVDDYFDRYRREGEGTQRYLAGTFENLMTNGTKGVWAQFKAEAIRTLAMLAAQALTTALGGLGGGGGGIGGGLPGLLGGVLKLPGFANGGSVDAGRPIIVGERRAELFVPNVPGRIIPRVPSNAGNGAGVDQVEVIKGDLFDVIVRRMARAEASGAVSQYDRAAPGRIVDRMRRHG